MEVQGVYISAASNMDVPCVPLFKMSDCPASRQSGIVMNKNVDAGTSPVPE